MIDTEETDFFLTRPLSRKVGGVVEIYINCEGCHGFGVCSICHDQGGYWDRPRPYRSPFSFPRSFSCEGRF